MRHFPKKQGFLEAVISYVVILILLIILGVILITQSHYNRENFAETSLALNKVSPERDIDKMDIASFIPAGLKPMAGAEFYDANSLYEKIDGNAELYLELNFHNLRCQRFESLSDSNDWAEIYIYDMSNLKNAFAVYSAQIRSEAQFLEFSDFAYKTQDAFFFVSGKYYVEVVIATNSGFLMELLHNFAVNFNNKMGSGTEQIYELNLFPKQYLKNRSFGFKNKNVFGFAGLENTFTAVYEIDGKELTAFVSVQSNDTAQDTAGNYCRFLVDNGAVDKSEDAQNIFRAFDFYDSIEIVFITGPYVAGIHSAENINLAIKLAKMLKDKLDESAAK